MRVITRLYRILIVAGILTSLGGCASVHTLIAKRKLVTETKISTAVFVEPVKRAKRTVYVDVRSGVMEFDRNGLSRAVKDAFVGNTNGYSITDDPDEAQYQMNIFVISLESASPTAAETALKSGYVGDDKAAGVVAGGIIGGQRGGTATSAVTGGLVGAVGVTAANAFVQDTTFMLVADVQVKEKAAPGVFVRKDSKISAKISDAGTSTQTVSEATDKKEYRTRIVTTANQANLDLVDAQEQMFKKTAYAMASFF